MARLRARVPNDTLWGGNEADTIIGSAGHDVLHGGGGDDWIQGGDGHDILNGGTGRDTLEGGAGNDALFGGNDDDWLTGGTGNDTLSGGAGQDRIAGGVGNDTTDGGAGDDVIVDDGGNDLIIGGSGNDTITGGGGSDVISGGAGHDVIAGGPGSDVIDGGAGNDTIEGRGGQDRLSGGEGSDQIAGGAAADSIDGGADNDILDGRGGADSLAGGAGADRIDGGAGDDRVNAGAGDDLGLYSKAANMGARDSYDGGAGFDTLRIELSGADAANAAVQADLTAFRAFLATNGNPARDNGASFNFTTMGLSARNWEALETVVVNQAPIAQNDAATAVEDGGPVSINVLANDTDADAGDTKALVSVTPSSGAAVSIAGNQAVYDPGTLFQFLGANAAHVDSFRYVMRDAAGATSSASVAVTVMGVNDAPIAQGDTASATEDGAAVVIDVLTNDTDADAGDTKTIASVSGGAAGTSVSTDGTRITYNVGTAFQSLNAGQTAIDVLTYAMRDAAGATSSASVTVTIAGANEAPPPNVGPTANSDAASATEDGAAVAIDVLANDTDPDAGDTKTIVSVSGGAAGTSVSTDGTRITYNVGTAFQSLAAGQTAADALTYVMRDAAGATSSATVALTITGVNDAPRATSEAVFVDEDAGVVLIDALRNAYDPDDGDTKTLVSVSGGYGLSTISIDNNRLSYAVSPTFQRLNDGEAVTDNIDYVMRDAAGATSSSYVSIWIAGVNDGPVAKNDTAVAIEDGPAILIDALANDVGEGMTIVSVSSGVPGTSVTTDGARISYNVGTAFQPYAAGQNASDLLTYVMRDHTGATNSARVTVAVTGANDAPVAQNDTAVAAEDGPAISIYALQNDTDIDTWDTKTIVSVSGGAAGTTVTTDGARITYDVGTAFQSLNAGQTATDVLTYVMRDAAGATSSASVTVTIAGANEAPPPNVGPTANSDAASATEDGAAVVIDVLANDTDPDAGDTKTIVSVSGGAAGTSVSTDGTRITYNVGTAFQSLNTGQTATDVLTYVMRDAAGATSSASVTVTIAGANEAPPPNVGPTANSDAASATEDGAAVVIDVLANDTDPDAGDTKTIVSVSGGAAGTSVSTDGTRITYNVGTAFQSLNSGQIAIDVLTYVMRDAAGATSSASVSVTVAGTADTPLHLDGTSSNDVLIGSSGNDSLWGRLGHDTLLGGAGDDYLNGERPYDASEAFRAFFRPSDSDYMDGGGGIDTVDYSDSLHGVTIDLRIQEQVHRNGHQDTLLNIENLIGSRNGDTLYGNDGKNVIDGGGHIDLIHGFGGDDTLSGSNLHGGAGDDLLLGDLNSSGLFGDEGNDVIRSIASGYVNIHGGAGDDTIFSGSSSDTVFGGTGNDVLWSGGSTISPGRGDTFIFRDGDGQDLIGDFGANAHNLIDLSAVAGLPSFAVLSTHFSQVGADTVIALNGGDSITLLNVSISSLAADDFVYSMV